MPNQTNNISTSFSFLLSFGILFLSQVNATVNLKHRQLPCESACVHNDDDEEHKLSQTDGIVIAAIFGTGVIGACLCILSSCCNNISRRAPLPTTRTPLLQHTVFQEPPRPQTSNIEMPTSPPTSTYGDNISPDDEVDDGFSARTV